MLCSLFTSLILLQIEWSKNRYNSKKRSVNMHHAFFMFRLKFIDWFFFSSLYIDEEINDKQL